MPCGVGDTLIAGWVWTAPRQCQHAPGTMPSTECARTCALRRNGYGVDPPGQANLAIASSAVGQRYKCLAFTLEMPFKDTDYSREPVRLRSPSLHAQWAFKGLSKVPCDTQQQCGGVTP